MNEYDLFELLSDLDEEKVRDAGDALRARPRPAPWKWAVPAACLLLAAGVAAFALRPAPRVEAPALETSLSAPKAPAGYEAENRGDPVPQAPDGSFDVEPRSPETWPADLPEEELAEPEPTEPVGTESALPLQSLTDGVTVPPVEVPKTGDLSELDMIGLVVYHGAVYTQGEGYFGEDAERVDALCGAYLGEVRGSIDEWSGPEDYEQEFVGSVAGPLYTVKGYDEDFRLCVRVETQDENGEPALWIEYLERLNGITLTRGAELFEDRLHLRENFASLQWQSHEDWNRNLGGYHDAGLDPALWEAFLDELDAGAFVDLWDPETCRYRDESHPDLLGSSNQVHLILTQKDGTLLRLRLFEGGWVNYDSGALSTPFFVHIPGETFEAVFAACGGK